jgi:hypothetical protein
MIQIHCLLPKEVSTSKEERNTSTEAREGERYLYISKLCNLVFQYNIVYCIGNINRLFNYIKANTFLIPENVEKHSE